MKVVSKYLHVLTCFLFVFTFNYAAEAFYVQTGDKLFVIGTVVNLRAGVGTNKEIKAKLTIGTEVESIGSHSGGPSPQHKGGFTSWHEIRVRSGSHKGEQGWLAIDFLAQKRPTLESLIAAYDNTPAADIESRRMWAERAVAFDPASTEAAKRLQETPQSFRPELQAAIDAGDIEKVKQLIKDGADIDMDLTPFGSEGVRGITPLVGALFRENLEITKYLIGRGADVNARAMLGMGEDHYTPLSISAQKGYLDIVRLLLTSGANPNHCVSSAGGANGTPLILAIQNNHVEIAKLLVEKGADVNALGCQYGGYGIATLCAATENPEITKLLLSSGANVNRRAEDGSTPLMCAARNGNPESTDLLLKAGANPNATDANGMTALLWVFRVNWSKIKRDTNTFEDYRDEVHSQRANVARLLLKSGANPDIRDKNGKSFSDALNKHGNQEFAAAVYPAETSKFSMPRPEVFQINPRTHVNGAYVSGNYLYLAESGRPLSCLEIFDISDRTNPVSLSATLLPKAGHDVAVSKNIAYVAADQHGLQIFDVSKPQNPTLIGKIGFPNFTTKVQVVDNLAYVLVIYSRRHVWIKIVDVSDPGNLKVVGEYYSKDTSASRFKIYKNHIFLAHDKAGLYVIDVTQPTSPVLKSKVQFKSAVTDVFVVDDVAYVALSKGREVRVLDVSDLQHPKLIEGLDFNQMFIPYNKIVLVKAYQLLVDIRDKHNPKLLAALSHRSGIGHNYLVHDNILVRLFKNQIVRFPKPIIQSTK